MFAAPHPRGRWDKTDYTKAQTKIVPLRGNLTLIRIETPEDLNNIVVLSGPDGYLMVDHPEVASHPIIQKALDDLGKRPVKFLLNTHWHYDHVGGNEIYGPDTIIVAQENVRKRLMTKQTPPWSPTPIGPYPERAWPRFTFRDSLTIHFDGEDIELDHYANGHTDGDSVVYFSGANVVVVGDIFDSKGRLSSRDWTWKELPARSSAVLEHINDDTIIVSGHGELENRRDLALYVSLLNETIERVRQEISAGKAKRRLLTKVYPKYGSRGLRQRTSPRARFHAAHLRNANAHQQSRPVASRRRKRHDQHYDSRQ